MKQKKWKFSPIKYRHSIMAFLRMLLCLCITGAFIRCVVLFYPESDFHFWGYVMFAVLYVIVFVANANMYHCFEVGSQRRREFIFSLVLSTLLTNVIMYFFLSLLCKYIISPIPLLLTTAIQILVGTAILILSNLLFFALRPDRSAVMVMSATHNEQDLKEKFSRVRDSYQIRATVTDTMKYKDIVKEIDKYGSVIMGQIDTDLKYDLIKYCFENNKRLFIMPTIQDIILKNSKQTFVADSVVYLARNRVFTSEQLIVKRIVDIVFSFLGIIITSPFMLLTAAAIKLYDKGPVLFKQERYTRNFEHFMIYKFRSMVVDAEKNGAQFTVENDPRITPVGKVIRATRIDELPQLFNIIKGDMSLVGPRAERIENVDYYCKKLPEFKYRMKVKAGLTGYAQIYGRYNTSYEDKLKLDLLYIENASLIQDFQLMFQTIRVLFFSRESTEGFTDSTISEMDKSHK